MPGSLVFGVDFLTFRRADILINSCPGKTYGHGGCLDLLRLGSFRIFGSADGGRGAVESQAKWHTESVYGRNPVRVKTPPRAAAL